MRNHHIYFTCAHQSIYQLDEKLRNSLFSLGTYIFGRSATIQEARELGDLLYKRDPMRVKYSHRVWASEPVINSYSGRIIGSNHFVIDQRPEFMKLDDQLEEAANRIKELSLFEFFLRPSLREGEVSSDVYKVNLASMVTDKATGELCFPNQAVVAGIRSLLETTSGTPIQRLLAEQDALIPKDTQQELPRPKTPGTVASSPHRTSDVQPSTDKAPPAHPPLPPRRHRLPTPPE